MDRYRGADVAVAPSQLATDARPSASWSGLVVDIDHEQVRSALFSRVEGSGRFVSGATVPSTVLPPIDDVSLGAKQSLRVIEDHTGRHLLGIDGIVTPASGEQGVDVLSVTGQPSPPVRLAILSLGDSPLTAPLIAASRRTITLVDNLAGRVRTMDGTLSGIMVEQAMRDFRPDVLVLVEGSSAEVEWVAATGTLASLVADDIVNLIIIVAADRYQHQAAQVFGERADLRGIDPSEYTPSDIAAALEMELHAIYNQRVDTQMLLGSSDRSPFVSRVRAGELVTRFLARRREQTVVALDVADGIVVHWAEIGVSDVLVRPDLDVHRNIRSALALDGASVLRWLPFAISQEDLSHWILNRALRPHTQSDKIHDVLIERAITIELLREGWFESSTGSRTAIDLIIAGRPFANMQFPEIAALGLLDAFEPSPASGIVDLVLDVEGLLPAAGAIGESDPAMATDVIEHDLLQPFATAVIVSGQAMDGDLAVRGQTRYENGESIRFSVPFGSVYRVQPRESEAAQLSLACEGPFTIGGNQRVDLKLGPGGDVAVGNAGLIIDARGRSIECAAELTTQAARVASWFEDLGVKIG